MTLVSSMPDTVLRTWVCYDKTFAHHTDLRKPRHTKAKESRMGSRHPTPESGHLSVLWHLLSAYYVLCFWPGSENKRTNQIQALFPGVQSCRPFLISAHYTPWNKPNEKALPFLPMPIARVLLSIYSVVCVPLDHSDFPVIPSNSVSYGSCVPIQNFNSLLCIWLALSMRSISFPLTRCWGCQGQELS